MSVTLVVNEIYLSLQGESTFAGLPCIFVRLAACDLRCSYCDTAYAFAEGSKRTLADIRSEVHQLATPFGNPVPASYASDARDPRVSGSPSPLLEERVGERRPVTNLDATVRGDIPTDSHTHLSGVRVEDNDLLSLPLSSKGGKGTGAAASEPRDACSKQNPAQRLPLVELTGGEPLLQKNSLALMQTLCDDGFTVLLETSGAHDIGPVDPRVRRIMDLKCPGSGEAARNRWENLPLLRSTDEIKFVISTREDYAWAKNCIAEHRLASLCPLLISWAHPLAPEQRDESLKPVPPGHTPISRRELAEQIVADALPVRFQVQLHKVIWPPAERGV
jgi:organic radical activating enzyme